MNTKTKTILSFITIFLVGFASGYLFDVRQGSYPGSDRHDRHDRNEWRSQDRDEQRDQDGESRMERGKARLANHLELTEEQYEPFFESMGEYRNDIRLSVQTLRQEESNLVRQHYQEFKEEVTGILNSDQLQKLDSYIHPDSVRHSRNRSGRQRGN